MAHNQNNILKFSFTMPLVPEKQTYQEQAKNIAGYNLQFVQFQYIRSILRKWEKMKRTIQSIFQFSNTHVLVDKF